MPPIPAASATATPPLCFSRLAQARSTTRKPSGRPPNFPRGRPRNPNLKSGTRYKPPPLPVPSTGSAAAEATTYTRLPPRDDFLVPLLDPVNEVKLSDSSVAKLESSEEDELSKEEEQVVFDGELSDGFELDYKILNVFEGSSSDQKTNAEDEDENLDDDDLSDYEEIEDEEEVLGFDGGRIVSIFDSDGNKITAMLYTVGEDEEDDMDTEGTLINSNLFEGNSDEGDAAQLKEKGVPAVMRCFDRAKIFVKAGDGGNGVVAFRREKFVPLGGPSGGDGGRGGNVYVEVDGSMNSLLPFRKSIHFRAGRGAHGQGRKQAGAKGEDVVVKVAPGTIIREAGKEEVLLELLHPGQKALLLPGGRGGRGNASFKSGLNKVPRIAENGEAGPEMWVELELKLVADVGIVGAPNAGKSTFLSVISAAQPEIANYPFTTLLPNLGVVSFDYDSTMVVADLPGLLEGAHWGFGLGHEFLRHTERCSALVHVVDGSSEQPDLEFDAVRLELEMFSPELAEKPYIVAYNKMDFLEAYERWPLFKQRLEARGICTFCMSAVNREGTPQVISTAHEILQKCKAERDIEGLVDLANLNHVADEINKQRSASINDFRITRNDSSNTWHVVGSGLQRFIQMTNWRYLDSERRFQHVLEACGVYKSLLKLGVKEGDTVIIGELEMVWHNSVETANLNNKKGVTRFS